MKNFPRLTTEESVLYAMKCYDPIDLVNVYQFEKDLKTVKYIKKLLNRSIKHGSSLYFQRMILNHIILMGNCFGVDGCVNLLFGRLNQKFHPTVASFLIFLKYLDFDDVIFDESIYEDLQRI